MMDEFDKLSSRLLDGNFSIDELQVIEDRLLESDLEKMINCHKNASTHNLKYEFMSEYRCSVCDILMMESNEEFAYWTERFKDYINVNGDTWGTEKYPELPTCKDELMNRVME